MEQKIDERLNAFIEERVKKVPVVLRSGFHQLCRTLIKEGAQWQRNSVWHDASEELPVIHRPVLLYTEEGTIIQGMHDGGAWILDICPKFPKILKWCYLSDIIPT